MTVSNVPAAVLLQGNGITTVFPFPFMPGEASNVKVYYIENSALVVVNPALYVVTVDPSGVGGNVTFGVAPINLKMIYIRRETIPDQQVNVSTQTKYDPVVVQKVWDKLTMIVQELSVEVAQAVKASPDLNPDTFIAQLFALKTSAENSAASANADALAAAASAAAAEAKENSMLRDRGAWGSGIFYSPSDLFTDGGRTYITQIAHFASNIAADLSASRIRIFADKGATGAGTGDMNNTDNLSGLTNKPLAFANIGGKAVGKVDLLPFSLMDPAAVITDIEKLFANKAVDAVPVAKAITDALAYTMVVVDEKPSGTGGGTFPSGVWVVRDLNTVRYNGIPGASIAANQITLPAGTYLFEAEAPAIRVNNHRARLRNITTPANLINGSSELTEQAGAIVSTKSKILGIFTLAGTTVMEIQHTCLSGFAGTGLGSPMSSPGNPEVYTSVKIQQIG